MKKQIILFLGVLFTVATFVGCGKSEESKGAKKDEPIKLVFSTNTTPGDAHNDAQLEFAKVLEEVSGGKMVVENYNQGLLFKQDAELAAVKAGQIDGTYLSAAWLTEDSPWISMFTAGYIFKDYNQMTQVYNGEIGKEMFERVAKEQGVRPVGAGYLGSRQINLVQDKEIKTPSDLKGINVRMPNSEAWLKLGRALGANPTPLAFSELYMALSSGTVDGQDNPLPTVQSAKFYEVTKSITITNHVVDSVWFTFNEAKWQSFTTEQKGWVLEAVQAGIKICDEKNLAKEAELVEFFKSKGLSVYEANLETFAKEVMDSYLSDKNFTKDWDLELLNRIQKM